MRLLNKLANPESAALREAVLLRCEQDILFWVNNFVWTYDPREDVAYLPMILFPKQEEFLLFLQRCEKERVDAVVEKSRDMGVTWLSIIFLVHRWLFRHGFKGGIGSRKEDLVDKADEMDSIFEKMRSLVARLPAWMLPKGFDWKKHDKHLSLANPEKQSSISGEAGDNIGRGGRTSMYFVDEAAFIERPNKVNAALSQNTNVRIYVSTPNGDGNPFAQKVRAARKKPDGFVRLFRMHWKEDPRKNKWVLHNPDGTVFAEGHGMLAPRGAKYPWYEKQKEVITDPVIIAQELDIDYSASVEGVVIPAMYVNAAIDFATWLLETKGLTLPGGPKEAGYDVAEEGRNVNVVVLGRGPRVVKIVDWTKLDTFQSAQKFVQICNEEKVRLASYDSAGVGVSISGALKSANLKPRFAYNGVNGGGGCTLRKWAIGVDDHGKVKYKTSKERFKNLRAETWWVLRERFEKTYEYKEHGIPHPLDELISIPDHQLLIEQLSSVTGETGDDGKIVLISKKKMRELGIDSPDYADALAYLYTPKRPRQEEPPPSGSQQNLN